ncbi:MAG: Calx-beta domain-containing protein, partial [bacterium]
PPTQCNFQPLLAKNPPANVCGLGGNPTLVYSENVEGSIASWTRTNQGVFAEYVPRDWKKVSSLPGGRAGAAFYAADDSRLGDCSPGSNDQSGVVYLDSPAIVLPNTASGTRVAFDHYVATELGWDGGNLKVSANGGAWQDVPASRFVYNPYNSSLFTDAQGNTDPLFGQQAFTGTDAGTTRGSWGKSIVDLSGLVAPGDSIQLRFSLGTDGCGGALGWFVDDINVYQCSGPALSINDVTVTEGNAGTTSATFTVTLSETSEQTVQVNAYTADGTATAPADYTALPGTLLTFVPGSTSQTVTVLVNGETDIESNENFSVNLSAPLNAVIADGQGIGTITDDDTPVPVVPVISISDSSTDEGQSGSHNMSFTVSLDQPTTTTVTVQVDTADDTATGGSDYTSVAAATVTFNPGETSKSFDVEVLSDRVPEANETFFVNLSNASNGTLGDAQGVGTIGNDDAARADFNADLMNDLVWRDQASTGNVAVWNMNGANRIGSALVTPGPMPALS